MYAYWTVTASIWSNTASTWWSRRRAWNAWKGFAAGADVLVLDPSIPWGYGDGVLAMMHQEPDIPVMPVIVLTYGYDRGLLYRLAPYRIDDYQTKPLSAKRLVQRIQAVLASRQPVPVVMDPRRNAG